MGTCGPPEQRQWNDRSPGEAEGPTGRGRPLLQEHTPPRSEAIARAATSSELFSAYMSNPVIPNLSYKDKCSHFTDEGTKQNTK